mmetsp:Transcript_10765/g.38979  ORF Transcript_10765/g.38979 Transcript_10765/m.38979 type:complete len:208 (-) Transcript_10765:961-1584(-)
MGFPQATSECTASRLASTVGTVRLSLSLCASSFALRIVARVVGLIRNILFLPLASPTAAVNTLGKVICFDVTAPDDICILLASIGELGAPSSSLSTIRTLCLCRCFLRFLGALPSSSSVDTADIAGGRVTLMTISLPLSESPSTVRAASKSDISTTSGPGDMKGDPTSETAASSAVRAFSVLPHSVPTSEAVSVTDSSWSISVSAIE